MSNPAPWLWGLQHTPQAAKNLRIKVNNAELTQGQQELKSGDQFEVAGIVAKFGYENG